MFDVALFNADKTEIRYIDIISRRLSIPVTTDVGQFTWILKFKKGVLALVEVKHPQRKPLCIDLLRLQRRFGSQPISRREPLARALGRKTKSVIDATAGWGRDMMLIWMMGYDVYAVERSKVMAALLMDGLRRYRRYDNSGDRLSFTVCDAQSYLLDHAADCVYLDPMFPPKRKETALAKRSIRVMRQLVGDDSDRDLLFECAWEAARKRVVTKRPNHAQPWGAPDHTFGGKLMSYDVYLKH